MPRLHAANKSILFAQILDPYEVTLSEFAQIKRVLFAHVYHSLTPDECAQINVTLFAHVDKAYVGMWESVLIPVDYY